MSAATTIQTSLERFYEHLAYKPWCGDDKAARLVRPKESAITRPYIAPNSPVMVSWLVFDLDHSNAWIWEDKHLPEPNMIVRTPHTGRSHLYYAISPVCVSDNAHQKPIEFMNAVRRGMAIALEADEDYTGRIAKNPFCDHWNTIELHSYQYNLGDLASRVDPVAKPFFAPQSAEDPKGRNCTLFLKLRYWAYANVVKARRQVCFDEWQIMVTNRAFSFSEVEIDFRENEIRSVAKSVAKWTWSNYSGSGVNRGVMALGATRIPLQSKQRLSAKRTHKIRVEATEKRVRSAIHQLLKDNIKITKTAVAKLAKLSRQQLSAKYSHLFDEIQVASCHQQVKICRSFNCVNFGVNQIAAFFARGVWCYDCAFSTYFLRFIYSIEPINDS